MARLFTRASGHRINLSPGALTTGLASARTFVAVVRLASNVSGSPWTIFCAKAADGLQQAAFRIGNSTGTDANLAVGVQGTSTSSTTSVSTSDGWVLVFVSKAAGTATPRFGKYVYSSDSWSFSNGAAIAYGGTTCDMVQIGETTADARYFDGDIAAVAAIPSALTDGQIAALPYSLSSWRSYAPDGLWILDQSDTSQAVVDLSGNGANQTSITGTTVSTASVPILGYGHPVFTATRTTNAGSPPGSATASLSGASGLTAGASSAMAGTAGLSAATTLSASALSAQSGAAALSAASGLTASAVLAGDNMATAIVLAAGTTQVSGDTTSATEESGEYRLTSSGTNPYVPNAGLRTFWYRWTAASTGTAVIDTEGSSFDTYLSVYKLKAGRSSVVTQADLDAVASDDDSGTGSLSRVSFAATAGTEYWIQVSGFNSSGFGAYTLNYPAPAGGGSTTHQGAATLSAASGLSAAATVTRTGAAALSAATTLSATPVSTQPAAAALSAASGLSAAGTRITAGAAALSAASGLTAAATGTGTGAAALSAASALAAAGTVTQPGAVTLSAATALTASPVGTALGVVALSAVTTLLAETAGSSGGTATMSAATGLTAGAQRTLQVACALSAATTLAAAGLSTTTTTVTLSAGGTLSADGVRSALGSAAALSAAGQLTADTQGAATAAATLSASTALSASVTLVYAAAATLSANTGLTASGQPGGAATLSAAATVTGTPFTVRSVAVALSAVSLLKPDGAQRSFLTVTMTALTGMVASAVGVKPAVAGKTPAGAPYRFGTIFRSDTNAALGVRRET